MPRKQPIETGTVHHVFNRSIADYKIFSSAIHYERFTQMLRFFQWNEIKLRFSHLHHSEFESILKSFAETKVRRVDIVAYCIMPNHFHLILKEEISFGIKTFMSDIQNSYSKFFNLRHARKGPLWEGRFKNVACESDEQLLHLTRYVHLNPVTANLVDNPEDWPASSYQEYIQTVPSICRFERLISMRPKTYEKFVKNRIEDQKTLARIKKLIFD